MFLVNFFKTYKKLFIILIIMAATFVGGFYFGKSQNKVVIVNDKGEPVKSGNLIIDEKKAKLYLAKDINFDLYLQVMDKIKKSYVEQPVSDIKLFYGSLQGMVAALDDPYSVFFTPTVAEEFNNQLAGNFGGIGAEIGIKNKLLTIISPLPESPAEQAGILAKDIILAIDKIPSDTLSLDEAVAKIRGEKGTSVVLTIMRSGKDKPWDVTVKRDTIHVKSVNWKMKEDNIAYISLTNFNQDTTELFQQAEREIITANPKAVILDLRNNSGGYLETAVDVASAWIDNNVIVSEKSRVEGDKKYFSKGRPVFNNLPTVILVNGGSASASEIVAGALQDYKLGYLIGEKTFGKGSVQMLEDLSDGSSIKFTVAKWYTPHDRSINKEGIEPDLEVKLTPEDYNADKDPQLDKAIEYLKAK